MKSLINIKTIKVSQNTENNVQDFCFKHVTTKQVEEMLSHVKKKKSTGYDALPAKILKIGSDVLAPSLTSLVNNVIDES